MSDLRHIAFVWKRLVCILFDHLFITRRLGPLIIVICKRCNWYGGPTSMAVDGEADEPGRHKAGCIFGGLSNATSYWLIADGCQHYHGEVNERDGVELGEADEPANR